MEIEQFITRFQKTSKTKDINEVFTCGCCYWFAAILCMRFPNEARMMYDQVANHFMVKYNSRLYDITGDVTDLYNAEPWDGLEDDLLRRRIIRDCIMF